MDPKIIVENFRDSVTKHYFDMKGRVRRQDFWYFVLASLVLYIGVALVDNILGTRLLVAVLGLALLLPTAGMGARRLQDIGRDGSLVWAWAIPVAIMQVIGLLSALSPFGGLGLFYFFFSIGWIIELVAVAAVVVLIYFWTQPSTTGPNQFGPDPNAVAA